MLLQGEGLKWEQGAEPPHFNYCEDRNLVKLSHRGLLPLHSVQFLFYLF